MHPSGRVPDLIIGGAPRSGTTFLCHALERHPDVYVAQPYIPEPKVFIERERSAVEYRQRYAQLFAQAPPGRVLVEKTSYYLESAAACRRIRDHLPDVRLLFIVREPVARAYSNYLWSRRNGLETLGFEEAIALEGTRPDPMPPEKSYARPFDYLSRGDYAQFARMYFSAFGSARVKFVLYEHLMTQPGELLRQIQDFAGVAVLPWEQLDAGIINSTREEGGDLDPQLQTRLRRRMREAVEQFAQVSGLDLRCWNYGA